MSGEKKLCSKIENFIFWGGKNMVTADYQMVKIERNYNQMVNINYDSKY